MNGGGIDKSSIKEEGKSFSSNQAVLMYRQLMLRDADELNEWVSRKKWKRGREK